MKKQDQKTLIGVLIGLTIGYLVFYQHKKKKATNEEGAKKAPVVSTFAAAATDPCKDDSTGSCGFNKAYTGVDIPVPVNASRVWRYRTNLDLAGVMTSKKDSKGKTLSVKDLIQMINAKTPESSKKAEKSTNKLVFGVMVIKAPPSGGVADAAIATKSPGKFDFGPASTLPTTAALVTSAENIYDAAMNAKY